jgi:hypothetical protein
MRGLRGHGGPERENFTLPRARFARDASHEIKQSPKLTSLNDGGPFQQHADEGKRHTLSPYEVLIRGRHGLPIPKSFTS